MAELLTIDDLTGDIPAPAEGAVERVIVVGAGISGLTAANALRNAGVEVVVVEARDRIGGRLHTVDIGDTYTDLGGSWIHHPDGNPLTAWADHIGLARYPGDQGEARAFDRATGAWVSSTEVAARDRYDEGLYLAIEERAAAGLPDLPADEMIAAYVGGLGDSVSADERARLAQALLLSAEADAAEVAHRTSTYWLGHLGEYGGPNLGPKPVGGYRNLLAPLAAGLEIVLGFDVASIVQSPDGATVTALDGRVETGSHVIATIPFGVLKTGRIAFSPALPARLTEVLARQTFSSMEKVLLAFDEPFWRIGGHWHGLVHPVDRAEAAVSFHDFREDAALATFMLFASSHRHTLDVTDAEAVEWAKGMLREFIGGEIPEPIETIVTRWRDDPYALGSYSHAVPGTVAEVDYAEFADPHGRVLWAGEHTFVPRMGYADAAFVSGIREAKRLLQRPAVELG